METKYIYIYQNLDECSYGSYLDFDDFEIIQVSNSEDVIEYLFSNNTGMIDLNYIDYNNKISEFYYVNLSIWKFNENHLEWLLEKEIFKTKFIEINNKLK